jgi:hypothetical protein
LIEHTDLLEAQLLVKIAGQVISFVIIKGIDSKKVFLERLDPIIDSCRRANPDDLVLHEIIPYRHARPSSNASNNRKDPDLFHEFLCNGFGLSRLVSIIAEEIFVLPLMPPSFRILKKAASSGNRPQGGGPCLVPIDPREFSACHPNLLGNRL